MGGRCRRSTILPRAIPAHFAYSTRPRRVLRVVQRGWVEIPSTKRFVCSPARGTRAMDEKDVDVRDKSGRQLPTGARAGRPTGAYWVLVDFDHHHCSHLHCFPPHRPSRRFGSPVVCAYADGLGSTCSSSQWYSILLPLVPSRALRHHPSPLNCDFIARYATSRDLPHRSPPTYLSPIPLRAAKGT